MTCPPLQFFNRTKGFPSRCQELAGGFLAANARDLRPLAADSARRNPRLSAGHSCAPNRRTLLSAQDRSLRREACAFITSLHAD